MLTDLFEHCIAKVVGEDPGEAGSRISRDQSGDDAKCDRRARHAVDHRFVGEGHGEDDGLADDDQQESRDHSGLQLAFALRPEHRQEAEKRLNAPALFAMLFLRLRHRGPR